MCLRSVWPVPRHTRYAVPGTRAPPGQTCSCCAPPRRYPAFDAYFTTILAPSYAKATGAKVAYELVSPDKLEPRVASAAANGIGPDIALRPVRLVVPL